MYMRVEEKLSTGLQFAAGIKRHWTPLFNVSDNVNCSLQSVGSKFSMPEKAWSRRAIVYDDSVRANFWPGQIRGPPLKGKNSQPGRRPSHRSGRNSSASSPKNSFRRCITKVL